MRTKHRDRKKRDRTERITEQKSSKKAKNSVRTTELQNRRFLDLVQGLDTIVWEADAATWQFTFVNERAERILGYPVEQWLTEPDFWAKHIHPEDRQEAVAYCRTATQQGKDHEFEYRAVAADGRAVWLRDIVHVVKDDKGRVRQLRGVMVDITERKRAERAVRESEARNRGILDSALDCIITMDHQGMVIEFNPAAEKTFGYKRAGVIGKSLAELIVPPSLRERHYRGLAHYLATGDGPVLGKRIEMTVCGPTEVSFPLS